MHYSARLFAQLTGVTVKALRHYERRGLLTPSRTDAGYRRYSLIDLRRLEEILALKSLGLPLSQIARVLPGGDVDALRAQRARLVDARTRLDRAIAALDAVVDDPDPARALRRFMMNTSWERWEERRREAGRGVPRPPDRVGATRRALFHDIAAALDAGPVDDEIAQALRARWRALIDAETDGNAEVKEALERAWNLRTHWPDGMRRYVASLYEMEFDAWERVAQFIDGSRSG
jgi:MerR family transcriptional regulator, thiopeptide resistance regulator